MLETNQYFDGKVASIAFQGESLPATVGVMTPGDYAFDTNQLETVTVISGALTVKLPDQENWNTFSRGEEFKVPANVQFQVKVEADTAYLCTYE